MQTALAPIMRDYLIRFQQTAIKETGRRPLTFLRTPLDEKLLLPGCQRPGYAFWQPIPWQDGNVPLGPLAGKFHRSIVEYLSMWVGFEYDVVQFHFAHRIGQLALPESHHAADSVGEIAAGFQFPVGAGILRKGVEHAPQP